MAWMCLERTMAWMCLARTTFWRYETTADGRGVTAYAEGIHSRQLPDIGTKNKSPTYLVGPVQPADLDPRDLGIPPAPDVLGALCDFLPPCRELVEAHREQLLLELESSLGAHTDADDDADRAEAAQRRVEQVGILVGLPRDAHDGCVRKWEDDVEEGGVGRDGRVGDSGAVRRGRQGAGEGLVRDGAEGREGQVTAFKYDRVQVAQEDAALGVKSHGVPVDLCQRERNCRKRKIAAVSQQVWRKIAADACTRG